MQSNKFNLKKNKTKIVVFAFSLVFLFFLLPMSVTYFTHQYHFGTRVTHQNEYFAYLSEKYPNFTREIVQFPSDQGQLLEGAFLYQDPSTLPKGLIVWVHGMKVNYENYLGEIERLTQDGYLVFTYNNTGVDTSEGDDLKGLLQSPIDLQHALAYLDTIEVLQALPLILIGHSWGGFSVATVSQLDIPREADGIITLAGFWRNINVIEDIARYYVGDIISVLVPYLTLYENYLFQENSHLNGVDGLRETSARVLMMHSEDDIIVNYSSNFLFYQSIFEDDPRFSFLSFEDAGHKLTVNKVSYDRIHDIMHHQMELSPSDTHYQSLEEERLVLIEDYNHAVMDAILSFCNEISG